MLNVIDEFTPEALAIEIDRCIDDDGVVEVLDRLALVRGAPHYVRFDNVPSSSRRVKGPGRRRPQSAKRVRFMELHARGWSVRAAAPGRVFPQSRLLKPR
jgi:hypothetical protein